MRLSLTARLALLFAAATAGLLVVVAVVLGRAVEAHFDELDAHELAGRMTLIGNQLQRTGDPQALATLPRRLDDALVGFDTVAVLIRDAEGAEIYAFRPSNFDAAQRAGTALPAAGAAWTQDGRRYIGRESVFRLPAPDAAVAAGEVRVLVALDISHHLHFLETVRSRLWLGISLAAAAAALLGWVAARRGLAPLRRVTATACGLSADHLDRRLDERNAPSEVRELVEAFNGMLDRLQSSFRRLSDFSADIAHELRTPVSNLMTQTAVALSQVRSADEYREVLGSNLEEYERIARMVGDMLFLAQAENGRLPLPVETVTLADEARALAEFYEALADEGGVRISVHEAGEGVAVAGDRLMLRRALSNLLSNALRHTPAGGTVAIDVGHRGDEAVIAVRNAGKPIPAEELPRIFERFHRAGPGRRDRGEGAGLGLAITRSIVEAHGGRVEAASDAGETRFILHLPLARPRPARVAG
ncbi:heavy metal sensor histidine kinase [Thauera sinica]|uniref:Sensor protein n=1 Tax=Thauera sinica TaxID=2665146 RepID=A0ABW1AX26_9RHOO|nr:heavy metal sensor histidine kinase [Thauera sp. K11]ATE61105.1 two-component sensor histidine kinase [Thauera sp. K11]